jgi:hypothetical protein
MDQTPIRGEQPQIDWPTLVLGEQTLVVRWTFYAQWLLSKRRVDVRSLGVFLATKEPAMVDTMVECFAASVAENFSTRNLPVPTADHWAVEISKQPDALNSWKRCCDALFAAIAKMGPAAPPVPQDAAPTTGVPAKSVQ